MATTTTNYGFDIPQSTDLVKDGATAIATLGQDIDTAMNTALGTKKAGIVLLNTTSFSGVSSFSLAANTFSSTYDNYQIMLQATVTVGANLNWRGRTAGTDNSNSNYDWRAFYNDRTTLALTTGADNATSATFNDIGTSRSSYVLEIINPFASQPTQVFAKGYVNDGNGYAKYSESQFDTTTSFDSFTFISSAGTITGSYSVYGYNK